MFESKENPIVRFETRVSLTVVVLALGMLIPQLSVAEAVKSTRFIAEYGSFKVGGQTPHMVLKKANGMVTYTAAFEFGETGTIFAFFQRSCKPCLAGLKVLSAERARLKRAGVTVTAVHVKELAYDQVVSMDSILSWLGEEKLEFDHVLFDQGGSLANVGIISEKGTVTLPVTVAVRGDRVVATIAMEEGPDFVSGLLKKITTK